MEININFITEDYINIPISKEDKQLLDNLDNTENNNKEKDYEKIKEKIREEINHYSIALKGIANKDIYEIKIDKNINENVNQGNKERKYDYAIKIIGKENMKEKLETKINSCVEKEKILINKQNEFKKLINSIEIDEKLLEKKFLSLIVMDKDEYENIINKIIVKILNFDNFIEEVQKVEKCLIKYRESSILALCFQIYIKKNTKIFNYLSSKSNVFLNNEKLFKFICNFFKKIHQKISDDLYDSIIKKISNNEIYKNNKEIYNRKLNFYKEVCYLFHILKYFEEKQEKEIYTIEKDMHLQFNEYAYDKMARVDSQIPRRNALNLTLDYLKKYTNVEENFAMALRRFLLIKQKYDCFVTSFKRSSFLYD